MSGTPTRRRALRGLPVPSPSPSRGASVSSKQAEKWASALTYHSGRRDFYTAFERAPPAPTTTAATKKKGRKAPEPAVFDVGDTVLIRVERGLPAVGVVVEMWERLSDADAAAVAGGCDARGPAVGEEADEEPGERYVRVKWFQRVKELPSMMANRLRAPKGDSRTQKGDPETKLDPETQLYYASFADVHHEFSPPLPTALVIAHCTVTDEPRTMDLVRVKNTMHARVTVSEATVDVPAVEGSFQQGKLNIPALYWCAGIADSTTGKVWGFDDCEGGHRARSWLEFQAEALQAATKKGRKAWSTGRQKEKPKPPPAAKPPVKQNFRKVAPVASPSKAQRSPSKARKKAPAPSAHVDDADEVAGAEASASSDDDRGSDARPSSEESEADSDEGDAESDGGATESDDDDDDDDDEGPAPGRGRKRKARAGPGGSPSKKRGRSAGGGKKEAQARKAHDKKVQKTLKRLRAPKSRPMQDAADQALPLDPYQRALHLLHVGATPESLPCREEQYADVLVKIEGVIEGGGGGCIYISGQPGTGKTATVHAVVRELKQKARDMDLPPFEYVEINGLKIPDPGHAYVVLWEALAGLSPDIEYAASDDEGGGGGKGGKGRSVSAKTALKGLEAHFGTGQGRKGSKIGGPRRTTYVVLMDELDQLFTAKQDVVYNFFNWPTLPNSQLIVIAVANTMDMPEQLAGRVKSRMGMERINFPPYSKDQLVEIAQSRLIPHPAPPPGLANDDFQVIEKDALTLAAAKTTGVTGDARRMLDVCRRAVEVSLSTYAAFIAPGTGTPRRSTKPQPVKTKEILAVMTEMSRNPTAQFVRSCSLYEKVMLAAVVRGIRKTGVGEIEWGRIKLDHSLLLSSLTNLPPFRTRLLASEYSVILASLVASYALSVATITGNGGAANVVEDRRKVGLGSGMDESEVGRVLRNLQGEIGGEAKWTGMF